MDNSHRLVSEGISGKLPESRFGEIPKKLKGIYTGASGCFYESHKRLTKV